MSDRDRNLQRAFDRYHRGEGPPPDTDDDAEAAAYEFVYASLNEEPEGELPDDFPETVANRVGLSRRWGFDWAEGMLLLLIIAGAGAGLVWMPPSLASLQQGIGTLLLGIQDVSGAVRLDVVVTAVLVLLTTLGFDAFLRRQPKHSSLTV